MGSDERARLLGDVVRAIASRCPRLIAECYWAGTSAIALEEIGHRESFDLDFHSRHAFVDTRPFLAELQRAFPDSLELIEAPDARRSGFSAVIQLEDERLTLQVFAAFEDVPDRDLVRSSTEAAVYRVSLQRYLADKVQCVLERIEARDLVDIRAVLGARPRLRYSFQKASQSRMRYCSQNGSWVGLMKQSEKISWRTPVSIPPMRSPCAMSCFACSRRGRFLDEAELQVRDRARGCAV